MKNCSREIAGNDVSFSIFIPENCCIIGGKNLHFSNGKAVHYNGASLLQWRSVRLDVSIGAGDIAGVGWERTGDTPVHGETPKGKVYFTYNGRKLTAYIDDVSGAMYPVVHIQKKVLHGGTDKEGIS